MTTSGLLECVLNEIGEALPFEDRVQFDAHGDAAAQRGIRSAAQAGGELFEADEPNGHAILGVEREVQEGREVAEELDREILGLVEDPNGQTVLFFGKVLDAFFDVPPQLCASKGGFESECQSQIAIQVEAREIGMRRVDHEETMRIQLCGDVSQGGGFANAGRSGQKPDAGLFEDPVEVLFQAGELPVIEEFSGLFAEWCLG